MELVSRIKTCQAGRRVPERNVTSLYIKWEGEGEVGTPSSKARTRWHQIKSLSIWLRPKEMFCIMHIVKLQNALPQAVVATESLCGFKKQVDMERRIQTIPDQMEAGRIFRGSGVMCLPFLTFLSMHLPFFTSGENKWSLGGHSCVRPVCQCQHLYFCRNVTS